MQITIVLTGQETPRERAQLESMIAGLYGASILVTGGAEETPPLVIPPAPPVPSEVFKPAQGAASETPLAEPNPAAIFTAGAAAPPSVPAAPSDTSSVTASPVPAAPTAPSAVVPSVPAAPTNPAPVVELDGAGLPWDGRINASTKTKTAKGVWTMRRGLNDDGLVARVHAELRAALGAPAAPAVPPAPSVAPIPPAVPPAPIAGGASPQPHTTAGTGAVPPAPGALPDVPGVPPVAPQDAPAGDVLTFVGVMKKLAGLRAGAQPRITAEELKEAVTSVGLTSLNALNTRPDLIPGVNAYIDSVLLSKTH